MNTRSFQSQGSRSRHNEHGMAVIVVIAIIAVLLIYIGGNLRTLHLLSRDLKQIEQKQIRRLLVVHSAATNAAPVLPAAKPSGEQAAHQRASTGP